MHYSRINSCSDSGNNTASMYNFKVHDIYSNSFGCASVMCYTALWVELAEIQSKVAPGNLPQKCPKNDDSHTSEYLFNDIQLILADFS